MLEIDTKMENIENNLSCGDKRKLDESSDDNEEELESKVFGQKKKNLLRKNSELEEESQDEDEPEKKDEKERDLEELVFGSIQSSFIRNIEKIAKRDKKIRKDDKKASIGESFERKPAWNDDADDEIVDLNKFNQFSNMVNTKNDKVTTTQIEESLKARYKKYYGTPMWADLELKKDKKKKNKIKSSKSSDESDADDVEEDEIFHHTGTLLADRSKSRGALPKGILDIKVCTDANYEEPSQNKLKTVEFHPTARVLLAAGLDQKLRLFQIDGKKNPKIQSIFVDKFPIMAAHFTRNGEEIIMGSRHKNFYYYDMIAGKMVTVIPPVKAIDEFQKRSISSNFEISPDNRLCAFVGSQGQVHLFSVKSKEWIDSLKINGECNCVTFSADSRYLFAFGDDKDVNVFDMNDRGHRCLRKFTDFGCLSGTAIAVSKNSQLLATGEFFQLESKFLWHIATILQNQGPQSD